MSHYSFFVSSVIVNLGQYLRRILAAQNASLIYTFERPVTLNQTSWSDVPVKPEIRSLLRLSCFCMDVFHSAQIGCDFVLCFIVSSPKCPTNDSKTSSKYVICVSKQSLWICYLRTHWLYWIKAVLWQYDMHAYEGAQSREDADSGLMGGSSAGKHARHSLSHGC